jgi:hypothetical protein
MNPDRKIAGSIEVTRPTWNAIACESDKLDTSSPQPSAPIR